MSINIANLVKCELTDQNGRKLPVHWLWKKQPAILVFIRHFACIACRTHAKEVWDQREKYEKRGGRIFFIGNGSSHMIQVFKEELGIEDAVVLTDPNLDTFRVAGFKRGFLAAIGPKSLVQGVQMYAKGHRQASYSKDQGDIWQLGGTLCIGADGKVLFHHISEAIGDYAPVNDVHRVLPERDKPHEMRPESSSNFEWLTGSNSATKEETDLVVPEGDN